MDWHYKGVYFFSCIVMAVQPARRHHHAHSQNKLIMVFNWIIGIILVFSATQLPEYSVLLCIAICICIKYPRQIYNYMSNAFH